MTIGMVVFEPAKNRPLALLLFLTLASLGTLLLLLVQDPRDELSWVKF